MHREVTAGRTLALRDDHSVSYSAQTMRYLTNNVILVPYIWEVRYHFLASMPNKYNQTIG